jgi:regulator of sirC expression with transglutaminase-like and TPR domain
MRPNLDAAITQATYPADTLAVEVLHEMQQLDGAVDVARVLHEIRNIAEAVGDRLGSSAAVGDILFTLNDQFFNVLDFHCAVAAHAAPAHSLLHRVVWQRYGEPLALGILYICAGRWLGLSLGGCDFPGRFLVRYQDAQGMVVIDPAAGGVQLQEADLRSLLVRRFGPAAAGLLSHGFLNEVDDRQLVVQLLRRLKQAYLKYQEPASALRVQERVMQLLPEVADDFRERGRLYELLGCPRAAAEDYHRYLVRVPDAGDSSRLQQHLSQLLRQPQVLH